MSLTPQPARAPIGYATFGNQRVPVFIDPAWYRYLNIEAYNRLGGADGPSTTEIQEGSEEQYAEASSQRSYPLESPDMARLREMMMSAPRSTNYRIQAEEDTTVRSPNLDSFRRDLEELRQLVIGGR